MFDPEIADALARVAAGQVVVGRLIRVEVDCVKVQLMRTGDLCTREFEDRTEFVRRARLRTD